jgi:tripartite-type tricarboxylate transporter receptor subunit TctC
VKANPGKYRFASSGTGATAHLFAEIFNSRAGLQVIHVPYKGSAPALIDVMGGQVEYAVETSAASMPHVKSGRLRAYGVTTATASATAPGIEPLATAANLPGFDVAAWIGIMVPSGTPKPLVDRLTAAVDKAMKAPDTGEKLLASGLELDYRRPADFAKYLAVQRERFGDIIKKNNIRIE